ncbi:MAG: mechanosensitive ion channel domain-containing protein [Patescibacteria group bacterium]
MAELLEPFRALGPRLPILILGLAAGYLAIKILASLASNALRLAKVPKALTNIVISLIVTVLWLILFSELARTAGLPSLAVKISGSLLVVGLAIANGASAVAGDILSGVFLAQDRDFEVGYRIKSGEIEGVIKKIDIRKTRIEDNNGCLHIIPNSKLDTVGWKIISRDPNEGQNKK